jgi:hypothetical protein
VDTYVEDFIKLIKSKYDDYYYNRNNLLNDLNIFYILEMTFISNNNMVRCLWHKDWDYINIHWNFNANDYLETKPVIWSMPRNVPLKEINLQFNGLSETLFKDAYLHNVSVSNETEL